MPNFFCIVFLSFNVADAPNDIFFSASIFNSLIALVAIANATGAIRLATLAPIAENLYNGPE